MKLRLRTILYLSAPAIFCSGCIIVRQTDSPGAKGVVMDSQTQQPIKGVEVVVSYERGNPVALTNALLGVRRPMVLTDAAGAFSIPADTSVNFVPIYMFPLWLCNLGTTNSSLWGRGTLVLQHDGYQPKLVPVFAKRAGDLGAVNLEPKPPN